MAKVGTRIVVPVLVANITGHALLNDVVKRIVKPQFGVLLDNFDNITKLGVSHLDVCNCPIRASS